MRVLRREEIGRREGRHRGRGTQGTWPPPPPGDGPEAPPSQPAEPTPGSTARCWFQNPRGRQLTRPQEASAGAAAHLKAASRVPSPPGKWDRAQAPALEDTARIHRRYRLRFLLILSRVGGEAGKAASAGDAHRESGLGLEI